MEENKTRNHGISESGGEMHNEGKQIEAKSLGRKVVSLKVRCECVNAFMK